MKTNVNSYVLLQNKIACFRFCFCIIICLSLIIPVFASAQDIANLHIEKVPDEGLTNTSILCITQDKNGFIWLGTTEGLFKYDGYNYTPFHNLPGDSTTILNSSILCFYAENKNLWLGSIGGLSCIDINSQAIRNFPAPGSARVNVIFKMAGPVFLVGTSSGLFQFNKETGKWRKTAFLPGNIPFVSICDDHKGNLYIIPSHHGFYCYTKSTGICKYYSINLPCYPAIEKNTQPVLGKSFLDNNDDLWICTWAGGLVQINVKTKKITQWLHQTDDVTALPYKITADLLPDNNGNIWIANKEGGLNIFNPSKNKFINYPVNWKSDNNISGAVITLFRDRTGIVWMGTENGLFKYDPHSVHLSKTDMLLKTDTGLQEAHISPTAMLKRNDGLWWMGMYEGLFTFDPKTHILQDYNKIIGIPENLAVFNIISDANGATWFTAKNLLVKVSKNSASKKNPFKAEIFKSADIPSTMGSLYMDSEKRLWIGTTKNGIFRFDTASGKFIPYSYKITKDLPAPTQINIICELSKDSLLIGAEHSDLLLLNTKTNRFSKIRWASAPANPSINAIYKQGDHLWIGTQDYGLWETNVHFKTPIIKTVNDGLPSMSVASIAGSKPDSFWLLTNSGAVEFNTSSKKFTVFDKKDGIQNLNHLYSIVADSNGNIAMGGRGCLYTFNPAGIIKNAQPPCVFITGLKVFDKNYNTDKAHSIELNHNQNYFSLEYVALNYTHSRLNKYAYKMDGLDKQWNYVGSRRYVSYANLQEGTYTFNVKACNNEGVWNTVPAKLIININPPLWHRWWFYLMVFALLAGMLYMLYMYNINQLKIRLQMRDKIARDLHDDIGSTLSGINIFSKIAMQKMHGDQSGGLELVEKISDKSQKTLDALSDIVWSINTRNDGVDNFLTKANEYLSILDALAIAYDFRVDPDMAHLKLGMILRKELYLIFKEAICNASKYAQCSFVQISLTRHKHLCTIIINDNGKGFDISNVTSGNGIYNMQQRAKKMNAEIHIASERNKGTTITLNFSITQYR